jgi:hypothetical protein
MTRLDRTHDQARGLASSPGDEYDNDARSTSQLNSILKRLAVLKSDFKSRMDLITQLTAQHQDLDIRFLARRLATPVEDIVMGGWLVYAWTLVSS